MPKMSIWEDSFKAGASFASSQYLACELSTSADDTVTVCNAVTDKVLGIIQNDPLSGEEATVMIMGRTEWVSDGSGTAIARGDYVGTNASGKCVKKATADYSVRGIACQPSTADGTIIEVLLIGPVPFRTALDA